MPPNETDKLKVLEERIKKLENEKVTVKRINMNELRKALAKEPQSASDVMLPHSVARETITNKSIGSLAFSAGFVLPPATIYHTYGDPWTFTTPEGNHYQIAYTTPFKAPPLVLATSWNGVNISGCIVTSDQNGFRWDGYDTTVHINLGGGLSFLAIGEK